VQDGNFIVGWDGLGDLEVEQGGMVESQRGQIGRAVEAIGTVRIDGEGSLWRIAEDLTVGGTEAAQGGMGHLEVSNRGQVVIGTILRVWETGTIDLSGGGSIHVGNVTTSPSDGSLKIGQGGTLSGNGTIIGDTSILGGGTLAPGNSPGILTIDGDYEQLAGSTMAIEVAGTEPGQFDVLKVTGNVTLGGMLAIEFTDGFAPQEGDAFELLNVGGTLSGKFEHVQVSGVLEGWQFTTAMESSTLQLISTSDAVLSIPGDYNNNGQVEQGDLDLVLLHWGQDGAAPPQGWKHDLPTGLIDQAELDSVLLNWGRVASVAQSSAGAIPEPGTALLLVCCVAAGFAARYDRTFRLRNCS
jgi:T5SS/PEP-CTERM-associated repeat protein